MEQSTSEQIASQRLIKRAICGDTEALSDLLEEFGRQIRPDIALRIPARWRSVLSEDDVMQQTYADAFRSIDQFVPLGDGAFRAWLASLAECNLRDALKMLKAEKRGGVRHRVSCASASNSYADLLAVLSHSDPSPSSNAAQEEVVDAMEQAIPSLPDIYQKVIRLYDLGGRPAEEVALMVGRSAGAVYMLRARAHDRLRQILGQAGNFFRDSP